MQRYDYLIVGAGMVAANAIDGIREQDTDGSIGILGAEPHGPVTRPALSKKLWTDPDFTEDKIWMQPEHDAHTTLHTNTRVTAIDRNARTVTVESGEAIGYGKLLLATGGAPVRLDALPESEQVRYFRDYADYRRLRELASEPRHVAVIGGSYIGTELAAALIQNGCRVTLVYPEAVLGGGMLPPSLADRLHQTYLDRGVELLGGRKVEGGEEADGKVTLALDDGSRLEVDAVVFGLGVTACSELAEQAGLEVDGGIVVDDRLATADDAIFAAGDVAIYPDRILGRWQAEHVDNANFMGATVGRIMAGSDERYTHTPYFYSNVFDIAWKAIGTLDSSLDIVEDVRDGKGVYYYRGRESDETGGRVKGILLLGLDADRLDLARDVLAVPEPLPAESLIGRIPLD
ncbi:NAD(P)/FAD-dependent oxidoreductase [Salinicola avicenniae]|uniref:NAD(P)/FAD-dependent oxidoreductase n=1 Tax=Salinicola avicenniae TaxID=2916836 RepID=UPI0020744BD4|nr:MULTISPECIES: FAD-dependent oxidoreductase [unclassified Salinicola]